MNKERRKMIADAIEAYVNAVTAERERLKDILESAANMEQDAYDSLPDSWQESEKAEAMEDAIAALCDKASELEDFDEDFSEIEEACGISL